MRLTQQIVLLILAVVRIVWREKSEKKPDDLLAVGMPKKHWGWIGHARLSVYPHARLFVIHDRPGQAWDGSGMGCYGVFVRLSLTYCISTLSLEGKSMCVIISTFFVFDGAFWPSKLVYRVWSHHSRLHPCYRWLDFGPTSQFSKITTNNWLEFTSDL